jgi:hypothetical protein
MTGLRSAISPPAEPSFAPRRSRAPIAEALPAIFMNPSASAALQPAFCAYTARRPSARPSVSTETASTTRPAVSTVTVPLTFLCVER